VEEIPRYKKLTKTMLQRPVHGRKNEVKLRGNVVMTLMQKSGPAGKKGLSAIL
jgi:hypothetical protein